MNWRNEKSNRMKDVNLSICVATKNRQYYVEACIRSILSRNSRDDFEIVVSDDSDDRLELQTRIADISDGRLCFSVTERPLSSIDNFIRTIENSNGKFLCLIGDDDTILPELFDALDCAILNGYDCVAGNLALNYRWPGNGIKSTYFTDTNVGGLIIDESSLRHYTIDPLESVSLLLRNGGVNYLKFPFPKFYHGIVARECFNKIKRHTGSYIGGLSPDVYTAVALSFVAKGVLIIDRPLTLPGVCGSSTTVTEGNLKANNIGFRSAPHFKYREHYSPSTLIPDVYCVETIWADSCLAAITDFGRNDLLPQFNRGKLIYRIIANHSDLVLACLEYAAAGLNNPYHKILRVAKVLALSAVEYISMKAERYINRIKILIKIKRQLKIDNLEDIDKAVQAYSRAVKKVL